MFLVQPLTTPRVRLSQVRLVVYIARNGVALSLAEIDGLGRPLDSTNGSDGLTVGDLPSNSTLIDKAVNDLHFPATAPTTHEIHPAASRI